MYVIQDNKSGNFLARPGSASSFTPNLLDARKFPTKEMADREKCPQSETVRYVHELLGECR